MGMGILASLIGLYLIAWGEERQLPAGIEELPVGQSVSPCFMTCLLVSFAACLKNTEKNA